MSQDGWRSAKQQVLVPCRLTLAVVVEWAILVFQSEIQIILSS
jgi:hypothetical protein